MPRASRIWRDIVLAARARAFEACFGARRAFACDRRRRPAPRAAPARRRSARCRLGRARRRRPGGRARLPRARSSACRALLESSPARRRDLRARSAPGKALLEGGDLLLRAGRRVVQRSHSMPMVGAAVGRARARVRCRTRSARFRQRRAAGLGVAFAAARAGSGPRRRQRRDSLLVLGEQCPWRRPGLRPRARVLRMTAASLLSVSRAARSMAARHRGWRPACPACRARARAGASPRPRSGERGGGIAVEGGLSLDLGALAPSRSNDGQAVALGEALSGRRHAVCHGDEAVPPPEIAVAGDEALARFQVRLQARTQLARRRRRSDAGGGQLGRRVDVKASGSTSEGSTGSSGRTSTCASARALPRGPARRGRPQGRDKRRLVARRDTQPLDDGREFGGWAGITSLKSVSRSVRASRAHTRLAALPRVRALGQVRRAWSSDSRVRPRRWRCRGRGAGRAR